MLVAIHCTGSNFPLFTNTLTQLLILNFIHISLLKMLIELSNVINSFNVFAYYIRSSMYSKWSCLCPLFNVYPSVVWLSMEFRGINATQKRKGDRVSSKNILHFIGIFDKCVLHAVSCISHWFTDSPITVIIAFLTQCSSIAVNVHECRDESQDYW